MNNIVAQGPRLTLVPWEEPDLPLLAAILCDPATMKHWPKPFEDADVRSWLHRAIGLWPSKRLGRWKIVLNDGETVIGDCGLVPIELDGEAVTDLGYIVHADHHGNGYGAEAAAVALEYGRTVCGLTDIVCHMAEDNHPSRRTAEKLGMVESRRFVHAGNRGKTHVIYRPGG